MVLTVETAFFEQERGIHRADRGHLGGLVIDKQERRVFRRDEMIVERIAHRGTGHGKGTLVMGLLCTKLTAVMVSSYHLIPVICGAVSGKGIGQIDRLVNDHFSRLRPTI
jgi:hypothetical protein